MSGALLVAGTTSDAGKSVLVAAICRWLAREGVAVAPFKAQNMALNSAVTADGAEIGRAQAAQAAAAMVPPEAAMNPILIKPTGDRHSQVVVMGQPAFDAGARDYHTHRLSLQPIVMDALADLRTRFDAVICEGAGSPAEINLRAHDLTNMGLARAADLPVIVIGDIDRGGVFAALYGTIGLLEPADQALVAGTVINRFRGDAGVLAPGLVQLETLLGRPNLGVLPHVDGLWLDAEDSLAMDRGLPSTPPIGTDVIDVAVIRLPRSSNATDADALAAEPGVRVRYTDDPTDVLRADLAVLPGTKNTVRDLAWLHERGLAAAIATRAAAGQPVLGICGGYQMLGLRLHDDVESRAGTVPGLGLLPVVTTFHPDKLLAQRSGTSPRFATSATGYEIRHGRVARHGGEPWLAAAGADVDHSAPADGDGALEGCVVGSVLGTSWHGVLEHDALRRAVLTEVAQRTGRDWVPGDEAFASVRARRLDVLGDLVADHLDTVALWRLLEDGVPRGLPVVAPGGAPAAGPVASTRESDASDRSRQPAPLRRVSRMSLPEPLLELLEDIRAVDPAAATAAERRHAALATPPGALGRLEVLGAQLCAIAGTCPPPGYTDPALVIAAGDHGVHAQEVSPWPQTVTAMMVQTFADGRATANAFAAQVGARVSVLDVGVASDPAAHPRVRRAKVRAGTHDLSVEPAMTSDECLAAVLAGATVARELIADGVDLLITGDMGIANTTAAAALIAAFTGRSPAEVTGRGTGIDDATLARKTKAVEAGVARHIGDGPFATLAGVGGLEHAALVGIVLAGAAARVPVLLDGVSAAAAACAAVALAPDAHDHLIAGHRSVEPGASAALDHLGLEPLLDLALRLGEGTGALLAVPIVQAAAAALRDVATLDEVLGS